MCRAVSCVWSLPRERCVVVGRGQVIIPSIKSTDPDVRGLALACLGMCCVLSPTPALATQYLDMLYVLLQFDQDVMKGTVLKALFDLVLAFGTAPFSTPTAPVDGTEPGTAPGTEEGAAGSIVQILLPFLHNEDEDLRTVAVEGFAKLLMHNHVTCPAVASQLVELYFNPMTKDDQRLQQCLSVFFPGAVPTNRVLVAVLMQLDLCVSVCAYAVNFVRVCLCLCGWICACLSVLMQLDLCVSVYAYAVGSVRVCVYAVGSVRVCLCLSMSTYLCIRMHVMVVVCSSVHGMTWHLSPCPWRCWLTGAAVLTRQRMHFRRRGMPPCSRRRSCPRCAA